MIVQNSPGRVASDEINLLDLWNVLIEQRKVIFTITLCSLVLALVYVFMAKPVYKAEAYLLPPLAKDIQSIQSIQVVRNVQSNEGGDRSRSINVVQSLATEDVYEQFLMVLKSRSVRKKVFDSDGYKGYMKVHGSIVFEDFNRQVTVTEDTAKQQVDVSFESFDTVFSSKVVNALIRESLNETKSNLVNNANLQIAGIKKALSEKIASKRLLVKQYRLDRITLLKEGLKIAEKLKFIDSTRLQSFANAQGQPLPLYLLGSAALQAEMSVLQLRKNDDPFIDGLRYLQGQLLILDHFVVEKDKVQVARVDQWAEANARPIKPKKSLIVMLTLLLGLMLGVCVAFIRNAFYVMQ